MVKSRQRKLDERFGVETSAKGTRFKLNRDLAGYHLTNRAELATEEREARVKIKLPQPEKLRTIEDLIHFDNVQYSFPKAKTPLLADVTFTVEQGGRLAFVGANGQGKTTLAKLIVGELQPTKGKIIRHPLLRIGYFSQHSVEDLSLPITALSLNNTPVTALSYFLDHFETKGVQVTEQEARSLLGSLGLQGDTAARTPLAQLSGGQKVSLPGALLSHRLIIISLHRYASRSLSSSSIHRRSYSSTRSLPTSTLLPSKPLPSPSSHIRGQSSSSLTTAGSAASWWRTSRSEQLRASKPRTTKRRKAARVRMRESGRRG